MAAKQRWTCRGISVDGAQVKIVEWMLAAGANEDAKSAHGNSVIMEVAGAGNTVMFGYFWGCIQSGLSEINLEHRNSDGHNLYAVSGCACEDAEAKGKGGKGGKKGSENREIKRMVREMVEYDQWAPGPR